MAAKGDIYASKEEIMKDKYASSMMEPSVGYFRALRTQLSFDVSRFGGKSNDRENPGAERKKQTVELWSPSLERLFR